MSFQNDLVYQKCTLLAQTCTSAAHQEICNIVMQCAFYRICIQMSKCHKNGRPKNEILG